MATVEEILLEKGSDVVACLPDIPVREAVRKMVEANVGCLVVQDQEQVAGIFTERDLMRRVVDVGRDPNSTLIRDVMSAPVETCTPHDDVRKCAAILRAKWFRHFTVVDNGEVVGVISLRDLMAVELHWDAALPRK